MKKLFALTAFVVLSSFGANNAFAQAATGDASISVNSLKTCTGLSGSAPIGLTNDIFDSQLRIVQHSAPTVTLGANVTCNYSGVKLGIKSANGGLSGATAPTNADKIHYIAIASWGSDMTATVNTSVDGATQMKSLGATVGTKTGAVSLALTTVPSTTPVTADTYSDTLTVKVDPSL